MPDDENRNRAQKAKVDQLSALYKTAVQEKDSMTDKVNLLTQENADLKAKIGQNQGNMTELQANQNSAATQLSKLQQQYQTIQSNNQSLTQTNQELTAANGQLKTDFAQLKTDFDTVRLESDDWQKQYLAASQKNTTLDGRVTDLSAQNQNYLTSINSLRSEVAAKPVVTEQVNDQPAGDVVDSDLEYENSQITDLNSDLVGENKLLNGQVTELQAEIDRLKLKAKTTGSSIVSLPALAVDSTEGGKYNVKYWIIPFLLIGLGVGLYTYFMEEHRGVGTTETRQNV